MGVIGNLLGSFSSFKLQSTVRVFGGTTATLTVPAGQIFKGVIGITGTGSNIGLWGFLLRDTNAGGAALHSKDENAGGSVITAGTVGTALYVELSPGTYFLQQTFVGAAYSSVCSIIGGLYANS